jgi:hypothetical protein
VAGGRAFGACCFAGKLRSPAGPSPKTTMAEALDPYTSGHASPYAATRVPFRRLRAGSPLVMPPRGLVGRKDRDRLSL